MADQLYLSYTLQISSAARIIRSYEKLLRTFPYSRLSRSPSTLRVVAVATGEPALLEESFEAPPDLEAVQRSVREYAAEDVSITFETWWEMWQFDKEWKLAPSRVYLSCFAPGFDGGIREEDLRVDFGIDTHFLPQPDLPNYLFMSQSNIRSLLHLVHELDNAFGTATRRLWTESGENFAEKLQLALAEDQPLQ